MSKKEEKKTKSTSKTNKRKQNALDQIAGGSSMLGMPIFTLW